MSCISVLFQRVPLRSIKCVRNAITSLRGCSVRHVVVTTSRCRFLSFQLRLEMPLSDFTFLFLGFFFRLYFFLIFGFSIVGFRALRPFVGRASPRQLSKSFYGSSVLFLVLLFGIIVVSLAYFSVLQVFFISGFLLCGAIVTLPLNCKVPL